MKLTPLILLTLSASVLQAQTPATEAPKKKRVIAAAAGESQSTVGRFHEPDVPIVDDHFDAHVPAEPSGQIDHSLGMVFVPRRIVDEHDMGTDSP